MKHRVLWGVGNLSWRQRLEAFSKGAIVLSFDPNELMETMRAYKREYEDWTKKPARRRKS